VVGVPTNERSSVMHLLIVNFELAGVTEAD
jgi:hypothetical protein